MEPKTRRVDGISYARYTLGRQIYAADVYPFSAPDGSKIIVCGHEHGLLVLWRAYRGRKDVQQDDGPEDEDKMDTEHDDSYSERSGRTPHIIHKLDLPLGTAVLHIAFPQLSQLSQPQDSPLSPALLQQNLAVSLACADGSIRLLTLPLQAPSPNLKESKKAQHDVLSMQAGRGLWNERMVILSNAHQELPRGVAMAFVPTSLTQNNQESTSAMDVIVASHSAGLRGTLLIHRIPINTDNSFGAPELWRSRSLSSPACSIDFHAASNSSPRVLIAETTGAVRIFDCLSAKDGSGNWVLSLFAQPSTTSFTSVLSAKWILGGQAIAVLASDGSWGIWDIFYGGAPRGISGARPTPFTISGRIGTVVGSLASKSSSKVAENQSQFAPMTPATRKTRQETLFSGKSESSIKKGGLSVKHLNGSFASQEADESLLIWYGDSVAHIPSLRTYWQNKFKGASSLFTTAANGHLRDVPSISLGGEITLAVSSFPSNETGSVSSKQLDLLVAGDRSLTTSTAPANARIISSNPSTANQSTVSDMSLLNRGLLDVNGLDRIMEGMRNGASSTAFTSANAAKRVMFEYGES